MNHTDVIVGFDGSPGSVDALGWAAAEAARAEGKLRVVLAYHWRWPVAIVATDQLEQAARDQATALAEAAAGEARRLQPAISVSAHAIFGNAADVLIDLARDAATVVVGHHDRDALSAAIVGETGGRVAAHARGCVVVVRGRPDAATGPVVVGLDGSSDDDRLLATAFEHAARRRCGVAAVRAFTPHGSSRHNGVPPGIVRVAARISLRAGLIDDIQRWRDKYPTVHAEIRIPDDDPAGALIDASHEAQLLVVGSRGHTGVPGILAGSVSRRLLYHCDCPLMVVRAPQA